MVLRVKVEVNQEAWMVESSEADLGVAQSANQLSSPLSHPNLFAPTCLHTEELR